MQNKKWIQNVIKIYVLRIIDKCQRNVGNVNKIFTPDTFLFSYCSVSICFVFKIGPQRLQHEETTLSEIIMFTLFTK